MIPHPLSPDALLRLVEQIKEYYHELPAKRQRGRPRIFSGPAFLLLAVVAVVLRPFKPQELRPLLAKDEGLCQALGFVRVPHRRPLERRLKATLPKAEAQVQALGHQILAEGALELNQPQASAIDGCLYQAQGPLWHARDRKQGRGPPTSRNVDTESAWSKVIEKAIEIALQAPTESNAQSWHFVVVTDREKKKAIADLYRKGADMYANRPRPQYGADDPRTEQMVRIAESGAHLYKHLHEVPVLVIACVEGRVEKEPQFVQASLYGSILPAAWSFMLALRARGVGSAWTTLHLIHEKEAAKVLGIPEHITQAVLMPVAYFMGTDFRPAKRLPARERTHWNAWGQRR